MGDSSSTRNLLYLFGGPIKWDFTEWTSSDDRVRGGKSESHLSGVEDQKLPRALFHGHLDITALGGAGFASQRTVQTEKTWNLKNYDGLVIKIDPGSQGSTQTSHQPVGATEKQSSKQCKRFTLVIKDTILSPDPNTGREQSTTSWEGDFEADETQTGPTEVTFAWTDLKPFYRGKKIPDSEVQPLKTDTIKRFSIMVRSHFGEQQGDFKLEILWIAAAIFDSSNTEKGDDHQVSTIKDGRTWRQRLFGWTCL